MRVEAVRQALFNTANNTNREHFGRGTLRADKSMGDAPLPEDQLQAKMQKPDSIDVPILGPTLGAIFRAAEPTSSQHMLRVEAAQGIGQMRPDAKSLVPRLLKTAKAMKDKDLVVMGWCIWALGQMGKDGEPALPELRNIEKDLTIPDAFRDTAKEAIESITGIKSKPKEEPKKGGNLR